MRYHSSWIHWKFNLYSYYANWAKTKKKSTSNIKSRGSSFVVFFFCLCFRWFRGASFRCRRTFNGIVKVHGANQNKDEPLHQTIVKQHTKLPMENVLYDNGLFFLYAVRERTFYFCCDVILRQSSRRIFFIRILIKNRTEEKNDFIYILCHVLNCKW